VRLSRGNSSSLTLTMRLHLPCWKSLTSASSACRFSSHPYLSALVPAYCRWLSMLIQPQRDRNGPSPAKYAYRLAVPFFREREGLLPPRGDSERSYPPQYVSYHQTVAVLKLPALSAPIIASRPGNHRGSLPIIIRLLRGSHLALFPERPQNGPSPEVHSFPGLLRYFLRASDSSASNRDYAGFANSTRSSTPTSGISLRLSPCTYCTAARSARISRSAARVRTLFQAWIAVQPADS